MQSGMLLSCARLVRIRRRPTKEEFDECSSRDQMLVPTLAMFTCNGLSCAKHDRQIHEPIRYSAIPQSLEKLNGPLLAPRVSEQNEIINYQKATVA